MSSPKNDLQQLIGNTLRWGVTVACLITIVGGTLYLVKHGGEQMPNYTTFSYDNAADHPAYYTTLRGIVEGVRDLRASSWIQLGVVALILTPMLRVALSLVDFVRLRDWLYAAITALVLTIILCNSFNLF